MLQGDSSASRWIQGKQTSLHNLLRISTQPPSFSYNVQKQISTYTLGLALTKVDLVTVKLYLPAGVNGFAANDRCQVVDMSPFCLDATLLGRAAEAVGVDNLHVAGYENESTTPCTKRAPRTLVMIIRCFIQAKAQERNLKRRPVHVGGSTQAGSSTARPLATTPLKQRTSHHARY